MLSPIAHRHLRQLIAAYQVDVSTDERYVVVHRFPPAGRLQHGRNQHPGGDAAGLPRFAPRIPVMVFLSRAACGFGAARCGTCMNTQRPAGGAWGLALLQHVGMGSPSGRSRAVSRNDSRRSLQPGPFIGVSMAKRRPLPIVKRQSFPLIRICQADIDRLKKHLLADPSCEQFAFALCTPMSTSNGLVLLVRSLLLPDAQDLEVQTANRVSPTAACQAMVYAAAESGGHSLIDFHTHTNKQLAALSSFDQEHAELNARYIANRFSPSVTHAWVVFNNDPVIV